MENSAPNPVEIKAPVVFISYSWDSKEHQDCVLSLADRLMEEGIDVNLDQYENSPPEGWPLWMSRRLEEADFVLIVCTETYKRRFDGKEILGKGHGVRWESLLAAQYLYNEGSLNKKFIPVLLKSGKFDDIPVPLQGSTFYQSDDATGYENLYRRLTNQPATQKPQIGKLKPMLPRERKSSIEIEEVQALRTDIVKADSPPELLSDRGIDYTQLQDFLKSEQWVEADQETYKRMCEAVGSDSFSAKYLSKIPLKDIRTINQLWKYYSKDRYGFSVQKIIWEDCNCNISDFMNRVLWNRNEDGKLDICPTKPGHFPKDYYYEEFARKLIDSINNLDWVGEYFQKPIPQRYASFRGFLDKGIAEGIKIFKEKEIKEATLEVTKAYFNTAFNFMHKDKITNDLNSWLKKFFSSIGNSL